MSRGVAAELLLAKWLEVRCPDDEEQGAWQLRWCVLCPSALVIYLDDSCQQCSGKLWLSPRARSLAFADSGAPAMGMRLSKRRPFGFVLEPDPVVISSDDGAGVATGELRHLLLLDARDADSLAAWLQAIKQASLGDSTVMAASVHTEEVPHDSLSSPFRSPDDSPTRGRTLLPEEGHSPEVSPMSQFDIDDFSDYEDDRHARSSSLCSLERRDWTSVTDGPKLQRQNSRRQRKGSRDGDGEVPPLPAHGADAVEDHAPTDGEAAGTNPCPEVNEDNAADQNPSEIVVDHSEEDAEVW
eukprot:TRINITY_DN28068_c1_g1_i1.p1 TRINITY_DN28068_c1_g1~~TRINITY_DN28068_c1_g1_i1.p1  ORF type:complete len:298 (+),score=61.01 TRINITY_DN28068_c1_g1_i1:54-947(+)